MDGDDDLFAVFDAADENAEDKPIPSSTSTENKVWAMDLVTNTDFGVNDVPTNMIIIDVPTININISCQSDGASLVAEICGTKRQLSVKDEEEKEESEVKKLKKEEQLVMSGLTDVQIRERMGEVVGEPKDEDLGEVDREKMAEYQRAKD